jgi:hypothetical protein
MPVSAVTGEAANYGELGSDYFDGQWISLQPLRVFRLDQVGDEVCLV